MKYPLVLTLFTCWVLSIQAASADSTARHRIQRITDALYQFSDGDNAGVFLQSGHGIIVIDPLNTETATWLQAELKSRFAQPVKFVVYSSHLPDRIGGASVFTSAGAVVVAHENTIAALGDDAPQPDLVFADSATIRSGELTAELHYFGQSISNDAIVVYFPSEDAMYTGDLVAVEQFPRLSSDVLSQSDVGGWVSAIDRMNRIDFVYLLPGHTTIGIQSDARQHGFFLRELAYRMAQAKKNGDTLTDMKSAITMPNYRRWKGYERLPDIIESLQAQ